MTEENGNCHSCPRGYGNDDLSICHKCTENCLQCKGPKEDQCIYCDALFGFNGSGCSFCNSSTETFDILTNTCQLHKEGYHEMYGDQETVGDIKVFYRDLQAFAESSIHVENLFQKYWISQLSDQF